MPICAIRPWIAVALAAAALGCDESNDTSQAQPEGMHLSPGDDGGGQAQKPPAATQSSGAAGVGVPAGSPGRAPDSAGTFSPPPPLPSAGAPSAGSFGGAGTAAAPALLRVPIHSPDATGFNACSGVRLDQFLARAKQLRPEFSDIVLVDPTVQSPGANSVSAYQEPDGKLSLVFRRGDGDCLAGCIDNEYWYILADDSCAPQQVGYYKRVNTQNNCYNESGKAQWDEPRPLDPMYACGADLKPQDLHGSYQLHARGVVQACARSGESIAPMNVDKLITLDVMQDAAQLAHAQVTVRGLGHPLIDDRKLMADVVRRRVSVHAEESNLPSSCPKQNQLDLNYDFEGLAERRLYLMQVDTPDCSKPDDYCKGYVELSLSEP